MAYLMNNRSVRVMLLLITALAVVAAAGCGPKTPPQPTYQETATAPAPAKITGITVVTEADGPAVQITGNRTLTYTSVKQPVPLGIVLYFSDTVLDVPQLPTVAEEGLFSSVKAAELTTEGRMVRVEIGLNHDTSYTVRRDGNGLNVVFPSPEADVSAAPAAPVEPVPAQTEDKPAAPAAADPASRLATVVADAAGNHAVVHVRADGAIHNFSSFTLPSPPRIVFDLNHLKSPHVNEQTLTVDNRWIKRVRHYGYPDKVRLVIDTSAAYLAAYRAEAAADGLMIQVGGTDATGVPRQVAADMPSAGKQAPSPSSAAGWVNRIDFNSEENGRSTILIGTTAPVRYKLDKAGDGRLLLSLFDAKLPDYRERPLITTRFESAVDRILPFTKPGAADTAYFSIDLREAVPYAVEQKDNLLMVHFEPSSLPAKPVAERNLPSWQAALETVPAAGAEETSKAPGPVSVVDKAPVADMGQPVGQTDKPFTGEKIALDFYETDIKNVFRILREVSGMNFAIDKDVSGTVTLSFDEPVPWDQVLDLILRMNQLGKVMEGNIVRIATIETLKKEEADRQAAMLAAQKTKEQELALEPLRTEYLPVSYSNAKEEVLPHIENIITDGRGKVDVDERSNLVVITDTERVIEQAKVIVQRLDRVTPQVIIEARVVEVNTDMSSELGIDWSLSQTGVVSNELGGTYNWDVAMNFPAASTSGIGFQFARIAGTPLTIDAQLGALESQSKGKVLSAPKIVTLDNKKASIKQGVEVGYLERDDSGGSSTQFKNVDLLLEVTPHVTPDRRVSMNVFITKNEITGSFNEVPLISTNEAETEFLVNDGETIVIGGILKKSETYGEDGFPLLKDVPGLKWLFKQEKTSEVKQELLIFITPKIVTLSQRVAE